MPGPEAEFHAVLGLDGPSAQPLHAALDADGTVAAGSEESGIQSGNVVAVGRTAKGFLAVSTIGN